MEYFASLHRLRPGRLSQTPCHAGLMFVKCDYNEVRQWHSIQFESWFLARDMQE
jgi:hypothetical protein